MVRMVGWAVAVMSMIASPAVLRVRHSAGIDETALGSGATIDFEGSVPWRTFRWHHGQAHYSGLYWSAVIGGHVGYESRLELAWLLLADREPSTRRIYSQPFQLSTVVDERVRRHVPDFLAVRDDGLVTVVDVKPGRRLGDPVVASTFGWARRVIEAQGWRFEVFTEPPSTVLANVRFLAGYRRRVQFDAHVLSMVLNLAAGPVTFAGVERAAADVVGDTAVIRAHLLHLVWSGRLRVDLGKPLSEDSVVVAR